MTNKKITFKKQSKETGLASVARPRPNTDIKLNGKVIGYISAPYAFSKDDLWHLCFSIEKPQPDSNPNCPWKWISMAQAYQTEEDARQATPKAVEAVQKKFTFHAQES